MRSFLKKTGRFAARGIFSLLALFIIALISLQIILVVGINAVNTGRGTGFILEKVNHALQSSGYRVSFDALYYDPVQGISLREFSVADSQGPFLHIDRFSAKASFAMMPLRILSVSAHGNVMTLSRLPAAQNEPKKAGAVSLQPFAVPDIYFRKVSLSNLSFEKLVLEKAVLGKPYEFSPSFKADIWLGEDIAFSAALKPGMGALAENVETPETIAISGGFAPKTLELSARTFSVQAPSYTLSGEGTAGLGAEGRIAVSAQAEHSDLAALTGDAFQSARATLAANGSWAAPSIDLAASLLTKSLKERGLGDISVGLKTENIQDGLKGRAKIETAFHEAPVTIEAALSYDAPELSISDIRGSAPEISVGGNLVLSLQNFLANGSLRMAAADLSRYKALAGMDIAGKLEVKSTLKASAAGEQAADIDITAGDIAVDRYKIRSLKAQADLPSLSPPWPQAAKIDAKGLQITPDIVLDTFKAVVAESPAGAYKLSLNGGGAVPSPVSFDGAAEISDLAQQVPVFRNIAFTIRQGASSAKITGDFSQERMNISLAAKDFRASDIPAPLPEQLNAVRIDLDAAVTGSPAHPETRATAKLRGIGSGPYKDAAIDINAAYKDALAQATISGAGEGIRALTVSASAPLTWGVMPFHFTLDPAAPLQGKIAADLDLAAISALFLPPTQSLSGTLTANGTLQGTVSAPDPRASLRMSGARFEDGESGVVVDRMNASAAVTRNSLTLESLSATDGQDGTISGKGTLALDSGGANLALQVRNFNAPRSDLANGFLNADMALKGNGKSFEISGKADILEMNILIPEKFSSRIPQLNIIEDTKETGPGLLDMLKLGITIDAKNQIFVRGWGLDAEFGGNIAVTGTAAKPQFNGAFTSRRGRFEEFGKRFTLAHANLQFQGSIPPSPYLDIEATTPAGDVTGSILLTGSAQSPSIKFSSVPALPEDEVLSRILFGKDSTKISPFQAVQLAQTLRRFSGEGGGGFDPLNALRSATGLDDISVETDESGGTSVGAGKYLTDNVYLQFSKGKVENSGEATIQIELTPSMKIESEIGQDAQGGGGIFWKRDY